MADLIAALRQGGHFDSVGSFTMDRRQALEKMREYQLVDLHDYVLNLVQAAVALHAITVEVHVNTSHVEMQMIGVRLPLDFLKNPLAALFISQEHRSLEGYRELAIGLNAALALQPSRVQVFSNGYQVVLEQAGLEALEPSRELGEEEGSTRVLVEGRKSWRLLLPPVDEYPEIKALQTRALWTPIPVTVNGVRQTVNSPTADHHYQGQVCRIDLWLEPFGGLLEIVRYGVRICSRQVAFKDPKALARVYGDGLTLNASGTDVVEDAAYLQMLKDLDAACEDLVEKLCKLYQEAPTEAGRERLVGALAARAGHLSPHMASVPVFKVRVPARDVGGDYVIERIKLGDETLLFQAPEQAPSGVRWASSIGTASIAELEEKVRQGEFIFFSEKPSEYLHDLTLVLASDWQDTNALYRLFGAAVRRADDAAAQSEARRRRTPVPPAPPDTSFGIQPSSLWTAEISAFPRPGRSTWTVAGEDYLLVAPFRDGGFEGEIGLRRVAPYHASVVLYRKRTRLVEKTLDSALPYRAWINHDDFRLSPDGTDVVTDTLYDEALRLLNQSFEAACLRLASSEERQGAGTSEVRQLLRAWLFQRFLYEKVTLQDLPQTLLDFPLFATASSHLASLAELQQDVLQFGAVHYALKAERGPQKDGRHVVIDDVMLLLQVFPSVVDYTHALEAERAELPAQTHPVAPKTVVPVAVDSVPSWEWPGISRKATQCLRQLGTCLWTLPGRRQCGITDAFIRHLHVASSASEEDGGLAVDMHSKLMARILLGHVPDNPSDPRYRGTIAMLAMCVLDAIRRNNAEVTDAQEQTFVQALTEWALRT